ncbi:hypothetical protein DSL96_RS13335, partial [Enterococcus hirae]
MNNLLVGNGVTIQFGGLDYSNKKIIKRARNNLYTGTYPDKLYHFDTILYFENLFENVPAILKGDYDSYTAGIRKGSLDHFKNRYSGWKNIKLYDVGLEDYFLIHFLVSNRFKVFNPERYIITQSIKMMLVDSIYNGGKIQELYKNYSENFINYLNTFQNVFTTNYDQNLEIASSSSVHYLHGAFHILAEVYNPDSFRNRLADNQFMKNGLTNPEGFEHLHSTALMAYSGEDKEFLTEYPDIANHGIEKLVEGYKTNLTIKNDIDQWKYAESSLVRNAYSAIMLKLKEDVEFQTTDSFNNFEEIEGELQILGLSPENDNHIFSRINENSKITRIVYYYFNEDDKKAAQAVFENGILVLKSVQN